MSEIIMESGDSIKKDERSCRRMKAEVRVYYGPSRQTILSGFSIDLSVGGLYLKTLYPLCVGDVLTLIFSLPGQDKSIKCDARVAWGNFDDHPDECNLPPGAGLQFVDLSLEDVRAIADFVENYQVEPAWD